jgi:hypothetical protein
MHKQIITECVVNGKATAFKKVRKMITAMGDHRIIAEKGGYIFSASLQKPTLILGILPYFINGHRTRHYDIDMPEDRYMLVGFVNANGTLDLMFKVSRAEYKAGLSKATKQKFAEKCISFAAFIIDHGFPEDCTINQVTVCLMTEIGIVLQTPTILALAQASLPE